MAAATHQAAPSVTATAATVAQSPNGSKPPRDSMSHPIGVSWLFPDDLLLLQQPSAPRRSSRDFLDRLNLPALPTGRLPSSSGFVGEFKVGKMAPPPKSLECAAVARLDDEGDLPEDDGLGSDSALVERHGNFGLCSCPGKKVRLDSGPVNGRAMINRDLNHDFLRLQMLGIKVVVCCLNDAELSFLGAPWAKYFEAATFHSIVILRIPIIEGSCPDSPETLDPILEKLEAHVTAGENVLAHCRGGVGRAGLVACCFLIRRGYVRSAERAIQFVRSLKAIETQRQEDYVAAYFVWWEAQKTLKRIQSEGKTLDNNATKTVEVVG